MREEEVLKMIKDSADHVAVPESLEPENMMRKLMAMDAKTECSEQSESDGNLEDNPDGPGGDSGKSKNPGKKPYQYWKYGSAAAAVLLAAGLLTVGNGRIPGMEPVLPAGIQETEVTKGTGDPGEGNNPADSEALKIVSEDGTEYQAGSHEEVYDRFQELRDEEERRYQEYYGGSKGSFLDNWFGSKKGNADIMWTEEEILQPSLAEAGGEAMPAPETASGGSGLANSIMEDQKQLTGAVTESKERDSYSETNIQVEGVDEGDVVKTDGTYIYVASQDQGSIRIIRPDGTRMEKVGVIPDSSTVNSSRMIQEFYINGSLMTVIRSSYEYLEPAAQPDPSSRAIGEITEALPQKDYAYYPYNPGKAVTRVETYDLSDPKNPKLAGTVVQDGYYKSSRRSGEYVYVFTGYDSDVYALREEKEKYIPQVNGKVISADSIFIPEKLDAYSYLVVSSVDMRAPKDAVQTKAVTASGEQYYVSGDNIYIASSKYDHRANQYNYTELMKFSYRDGRISFVAHGNVNGYLNNQFSMDEYKGNLRLVSTLSRSNGKNTNSLYVLNEKLEKIGEIENLAPDEQIYSARFMGEIGYFVTFRNMDPLFSVDLTNPEKPKILGELKITGFSEYLHPYADGLLLGIGREIDPDTANYEGLKLSMFDTSNPKNVKEIQKMVEKSFEYSTAWGNHKSVLISPSRSLIGFTAECYDYDKRDWSVVYTVYSYDKQNGFKQEMSVALDNSNDYSMTRGLYIGDWLYVVENNRINSYSLAGFNHAGELKY